MRGARAQQPATKLSAGHRLEASWSSRPGSRPDLDVRLRGPKQPCWGRERDSWSPKAPPGYPRASPGALTAPARPNLVRVAAESTQGGQRRPLAVTSGAARNSVLGQKIAKSSRVCDRAWSCPPPNCPCQASCLVCVFDSGSPWVTQAGIKPPAALLPPSGFCLDPHCSSGSLTASSFPGHASSLPNQGGRFRAGHRPGSPGRGLGGGAHRP